MAADTAYLEGGPCNGETKKISVAESDSGLIVCKGSKYLNDNGKLRPNGDIIFKYAGKYVAPGGPPPQLKAPQALRGYHDFQHSINRNMPHALHHSNRMMRQALRSLRRVPKVGG